MNHSLQVGLAFGLTSGVITTLGLMIGLHSGTRSRTVVLGGILMIALADAFADALGIHVSEESEHVHTSKEVWTATLATFAAKCLCALSFAVPILVLPLIVAVWASVVWGMCLLATFSIIMAKAQKTAALPVLAEHLGIAALVIGLTHLLGGWISTWANSG